MKVRQIIVASLLAIGATAGIGASLARVSDARVAKADGEWLCCSILDLDSSNTQIPTYAGFDNNSLLFRCWKDGVDGSVKEFAMHQTGLENVFMIIAKLPGDYSFDRIQFRYTESSGQKYSTVYNESYSSELPNKIVRGYNYQGGWTDANWNLTVDKSYNPTIENGSSSISLLPDVANTRYIAQNVSVVADTYLNFYATTTTNGYCDMIDDTSLNTYFKASYSSNWVEAKESGTFDIILDNSYSDNGVVRFKKHSDTTTSYIYYVTQNDQATNDYIYAWGDEEQFGEWPGTKITTITGIQEVTGNGVLHFEGSSVAKLIYKIPVRIGGYPNGDTSFKFNNNYDWQSEERSLVATAAYWYTGPANTNASEAIEFLVEAEDIRNHAADYSVCNISDSDATILVNAYNALTADVRAFVDSSSVYTHKRDGSDGNELVSYRIVMEQLAKIANKPLVSSSNLLSNNKVNNDALMIVVIALSLISVTAIFLVFKKRKQN